MVVESNFIKSRQRHFNKKWFADRRLRFIESEKNSFELFLEEIENGDCFPENEEFAKKIIDTLKHKFNLFF